MLPLYPMSTVVVSQALRPFAFDIRDTHVKGRLDRARIHSHCTATATHVVVGGHGPHGQGGRRPRPSPAFSLESAKLPQSVGQLNSWSQCVEYSWYWMYELDKNNLVYSSNLMQKFGRVESMPGVYSKLVSTNQPARLESIIGWKFQLETSLE